MRFGWLDRDQTDSSIPRLQRRQGRKPRSTPRAKASSCSRTTVTSCRSIKRRSNPSCSSVPTPTRRCPVGGGSARVEPFSTVSFLRRIKQLSRHGRASPLRARRAYRLPKWPRRLFSRPRELTGNPGLKAEYFNNPELQGHAGGFAHRTPDELWSGLAHGSAAGIGFVALDRLLHSPDFRGTRYLRAHVRRRRRRIPSLPG